MKKLNKLQINTEKLMKNEDLLSLKGGYGPGGGGCQLMLCNCSLLPPRAWWGCYCSGQEMVNAINANCGGQGGSCSGGVSC